LTQSQGGGRVNIDAHNHGLAVRHHTEFSVIQDLISSAKFDVERERHVSKILVVSILRKLQTDNADAANPVLDIARELDAVVDVCISIGHNHEDYLWRRPRGMAGKPIVGTNRCDAQTRNKRFHGYSESYSKNTLKIPVLIGMPV